MDPEKNPNEKRPSAIRTMRTDAELYVKEKKLSSLQLAASSYASQTSIPPETENKKNYIKIIIIVVIVLLFMVVFGGTILRFLNSKNSSPQAQEAPPPPATLLVDGQNILIIKQANTNALVEALSEERSKTFRSGILIYYPIKIGSGNYINIKDFSLLLGWHIPSLLLDNLLLDFNIYLFANTPSNDIAIVMKTGNFEKAFLSMLEWERALARDWQNFLSKENASVAYPSTFQDEIIKNQDARVLKKDDDSFIIGYTILNKKYIIISTSREAIATIINRFIMLPPQ